MKVSLHLEPGSHLNQGHEDDLSTGNPLTNQILQPCHSLIHTGGNRSIGCNMSDEILITLFTHMSSIKIEIDELCAFHQIFQDRDSTAT